MFESCLCFNIAQKTNKISLLDRQSNVEQRGAGKSKRALRKTKGHSALLFWAGENAVLVF